MRVDSGIEKGDEISQFYDPMIAKLIVYGEDRPAQLLAYNKRWLVARSLVSLPIAHCYKQSATTLHFKLDIPIPAF